MDENNRAKFIKMNDDENTEIRTEPFYFDHAELSPTPVHTTTSDVYGRNLEKVYDKVFVYDSKTTRPYYIWTQFRNGQTVVNRLNKSYSGKWVTAKLRFDGGTTYRISPVGFKIVDEPKKKEKEESPQQDVPAGKEEKPQDKYVQLELFEGVKRKKIAVSFSELKRIVLEGREKEQFYRQSNCK